MQEIVHGEVVQVSEHVRRITAPNPGVMTGQGTNTYLVGQKQIAVVDPGPADQSHIDAILAACGDRLQWILVTHTHPDHSPAAKALAEASGAIIMGNKLEDNDGFQDEGFNPSVSFQHNDCLSCDEFTIRALQTPGHVDNHLCFLVEDDGMLLTGDHIMQGSTVVIIPPHGDMRHYINSLRLLLDYPLKTLGPGHGYVIATPIEEIKGLIAHRLGREKKVIDVLARLRQGSLGALTPAVYDDVDKSLYPIAQLSLLAHLIKLKKEGLVEERNDNWRYLMT